MTAWKIRSFLPERRKRRFVRWGRGRRSCGFSPPARCCWKGFQPGKYELVFLDIFLGRALSGIGTADGCALDSRVKLVFVTTSNDFASESYAVRADGYLLKPISRKALEGLLGRMLAAKKSNPGHAAGRAGGARARHSLYHLRGTLCHPDAARRQSLRVRTTQNAMAGCCSPAPACGLQQGHTG